MNEEKFGLTWDTYTDHLRGMLHDMMTSNDLTDVTLFSEDRKQFKAHKVVLSASSSVFKSIIRENYSTNPVIYLRGILSHEIESILQFIYLGKATFYQQRMNEFLQVGRSLEIKEISSNIQSFEYEESDDAQNNEFEQTYEIPTNRSEHTDPQQLGTNIAIKQEDMKSNQSIMIQQFSDFSCDQCDKQYGRLSSLNIHKKSIHEGVKYPCNLCNYKANRLGSLQLHINSVHEKVKYLCDKCDYKATQTASLNQHIKAVHEGFKYSCEQCNYKSSKSSILRRHEKTVHNAAQIIEC